MSLERDSLVADLARGGIPIDAEVAGSVDRARVLVGYEMTRDEFDMVITAWNALDDLTKSLGMPLGFSGRLATAAVGLALERCPEEGLEDGIGVAAGAEPGGELAERAHPGVELNPWTTTAATLPVVTQLRSGASPATAHSLLLDPMSLTAEQGLLGPDVPGHNHERQLAAGAGLKRHGRDPRFDCPSIRVPVAPAAVFMISEEVIPPLVITPSTSGMSLAAGYTRRSSRCGSS